MEEEEPWLSLAILQGPREGQTFEFRPGSAVRIGRVVRGNTFAIKDAGISSKHLLIKSESGGKWTVQDLDSSNGTTLNSSPLTPFQPSDLSDGDQIKFGEFTSMAVYFVLKIENPPSPPQLRRSRRSNVRATEEKGTGLETDNLQPIDVSAAADNGPKRRGRPPRARVPAQTAEAPPVVARVTRGKKKETEVLEESGMQLERKRPATTRGKKNLPEIPAKNPDVVVVEVKEEEVSFVEEAPEGGDGNGVVDVDSSGDSRRPPSEAVVAEGKETSQKSSSDEQAPMTANGNGDSTEQREEVEEKVDLEKMTAREWFDYMEVQLRKQTIKETEKIIDEMRKKAERVREYVAEQMRNKGGSQQ